MAMEKVNCELVCHFKEKLLLHVLLSLGFHVESNLKILEMHEGIAYHRHEGLAVQDVCGVPNLLHLA